jgi:methionyl aminopeptidase
MSRNNQAPALSPAQESAVYAAGQCVVETHRRLSAWLRAGLTLAEIDAFVADTLAELDCRSCFIGYRIPRHGPFPNHACLSVNECVVHGTSDSYTAPLRPGDVLKIDIGVTHQGWIGDAARTYVFGAMTPEVQKLTDCGKECIRRGLEQLRPGKRLIHWARTVQRYVEDTCGFYLVRGLGGHGFGRQLHTAPHISNHVPDRPMEWPDGQTELVPGMLLAVEPMIAAGTAQVLQRGRTWPIYSADGSQTVHYEHDVLITRDGHRLLTEGLDDVPDVITR